MALMVRVGPSGLLLLCSAGLIRGLRNDSDGRTPRLLPPRLLIDSRWPTGATTD
jgi:hypothetical protein